MLAAGVTAALLYRGGPHDDVSAYIEVTATSRAGTIAATDAIVVAFVLDQMGIKN